MLLSKADLWVILFCWSFIIYYFFIWNRLNSNNGSSLQTISKDIEEILTINSFIIKAIKKRIRTSTELNISKTLCQARDTMRIKKYWKTFYVKEIQNVIVNIFSHMWNVLVWEIFYKAKSLIINCCFWLSLFYL